MNNQHSSRGCIFYLFSWLLIIVFFPFSLFFLPSFINKNRQNFDGIKITGKIVEWFFGYILLIDGLLYIFVGIHENIKGMLITGIVFFISGIFFIIIGRNLLSKFKNKTKIFSLIKEEKIEDINEIAKRTNTDIKFTRETIDYIINNNFYSRLILKIEANKIIYKKEISKPHLKNKTKEIQYITQIIKTNESPNIRNSPKIYRCESCGAPIKVKAGEIEQCDYCGNYIYN